MNWGLLTALLPLKNSNISPYPIVSPSVTYIYMILTSNLLPKEHRQVWGQATAHTNEIHQINTAHLTGAEMAPTGMPNGTAIP